MIMKAHEALAIYRLKPKQTVSPVHTRACPEKTKTKTTLLFRQLQHVTGAMGGGFKKKKRKNVVGVWVLGVQVIVVYDPTPPIPPPRPPARPSPYSHRCKLSLKRL